MQKKITVVIPSIGRKTLLARALNSLKNQIVAPDEIIIVNTGSYMINSGDIPKALLGITKIVNKKNRLGVSCARNLGASKANFDFIGFLDDDDEWSNEVILNFKNMKTKINSFIFFPIISRELSGKFTRIRRAKVTNLKTFEKYLLHGNPGIGGSNFILKKKDFFKVGGYDEKLVTGEDRDLTLRLVKNGLSPESLKEGFAIYNIQAGSLSRKRIWQGQLEFYSKHKEKYSLLDISLVIIRIIKIYLIQLYRFR